MATTINFNCPNCDSPLIVPAAAAGKRIKCKHCTEVIAVPGATPAAKPVAKAAPAAKPVVKAVPAATKPVVKAVPPPPPPPPPAADADAPFKLKDDDDDDNPNPYGMVAETDVPRCPHCATELDPPDTKVCLNCGYDLMTRQRHKSKKVYETTVQDKFEYRLPAFIWIAVLIGLIVVDIMFWLNMESWMTGGLLDNEKLNEATNRPTFLVSPNCFNVFMTVFVAFMMWLGLRVIVNKLIINPNPTEVEKIAGEDDEDEEESGDDEDEDDDDEDEEEDEPPPKKKKKR